jgi:hypothetical protein
MNRDSFEISRHEILPHCLMERDRMEFTPPCREFKCNFYGILMSDAQVLRQERELLKSNFLLHRLAVPHNLCNANL